LLLLFFGTLSTPSCWKWIMWMFQTTFCSKPSYRPYLFWRPWIRASWYNYESNTRGPDIWNSFSFYIDFY
jgi:hypothetical protein